jgi:hypothetical protein
LYLLADVRRNAVSEENAATHQLPAFVVPVTLVI